MSPPNAFLNAEPERRQGGFTLIELMIVVAVIAILATIAYPSYVEYVVRSNRSEAQQFMLEVANREEQYLLDARQYGTLANLGLAVPARVNRYYTVTATPAAGPPPSYQITAVPKAGTMQALDVILGLTDQGVKTPTDKW
ncbi:MAG: type IV pilin protein [Chromatiaceae bacterium]|jgi:type IV pilus assembly protein PilE